MTYQLPRILAVVFCVAVILYVFAGMAAAIARGKFREYIYGGGGYNFQVGIGRLVLVILVIAYLIQEAVRYFR